MKASNTRLVKTAFSPSPVSIFCIIKLILVTNESEGLTIEDLLQQVAREINVSSNST